MTSQSFRPSDTYNPLYFLASVGAGGLSVTFFMYLMFWVPHKGRPVPIFEDIMSAFSTGSVFMQLAIAAAMLGIAFFAFNNVWSLVWNLVQVQKFKQTPAYAQLKSSNAEASLLAMPLAAAMTINAMFIVGLVFVPRLWTIVECLFPFAMVGFFLIGVWALKLIGAYLARAFAEKGNFNYEMNNSFAQALPAFALAMVAVGLAAPAAMSTVPLVVGTSLVLSTFFGTFAALYAIIAMISAVPAMLQHGVAKEAAPTLMIAVPLMTILGIMVLRQNHGMHTTFDAHSAPVDTLIFLGKALGIQVAFLLLGSAVLRAQGYFKEFVNGPKASAGSYALICPGVALSVMLHFFLNKGLVASQIVDKFSPAYWLITGIALVAQFSMVWLVLTLNKKHFGEPKAAPVPAE